MEIFLLWLVLSIAIAVWASNKGRSGFGWFLLSLIFSPLLTAIFLAVSSNRSRQAQQLAGDIPTPSTHVKCPDCAELVRKEARVCRYCGCKLVPLLGSPNDTRRKELIVHQVIGLVLALLLTYGIYLLR